MKTCEECGWPENTCCCNNAKPVKDCPFCNGEGVVDSGGFTPWGQGIMVPCGCLKSDPWKQEDKQ